MLPAHVTEPQTARLTFRRPRPDDLDFVYRLHSDPNTYRHAPWSRLTSREQAEQRLNTWLADWVEQGLGHWIVLNREGEPIGACGLRRAELDGEPTLNLYYRFAAAQHGRGLGREAASRCVAFAAEWLPGQRVTAVIRPDNPASLATAHRAGLFQIGTTVHPGDPDPETKHLVFGPPRFVAVDATSEPAAMPSLEGLRELWMRVNTGDGAVGFLGPAATSAVAGRLDDGLAAVHAGDSVLCLLAHPSGEQLLGFAFLESSDRATAAHIGWAKRVMVDPAAASRNLGRQLMGGLHALARSRGLEIVRLTCRGGRGLESFYARLGYRETGRLPGGVRFSTPDGPVDFTDVELAVRTDGRPLV